MQQYLAATPGKPRLADFRFAHRSSHISPVVLSGLICAAEVLLVAGIGLAVFWGYLHRPAGPSVAPYVIVSLLAGLATMLTMQLLGLYEVARLRAMRLQMARLVLGWTLVFGLLLTAAFFMKIGPEFSRVWLLGWYLAGGAALLGLRGLLAMRIAAWTRQGRLVHRAVLVGGGRPAEALVEALERDSDSDIRICGFFDERGSERIGDVANGYPKLGDIEDLIDFSRRTRIDTVIVTLPLTAENRVLQVLQRLMVLPVDIKLSALGSRLRFSDRAYSYIGGVPFIDLADRPLANWAVVQKWLFDKIVGTLALVVLSPLMLATAVAIKLDSRGPVLFRQRRYGFNNELIEVWKFRSMYVDQADQNAARLVTRGDPRVTRVGRFIRKTSLDELPQLFNVLAGTLSLVGPRPHALQAKAADKLYQDAVEGYFARHKMKPGLTGWAQINGWRGETDTTEKIQRRVECDLYYIRNWSILLDIYILAVTPFALLKSENAY